MVQRVQSCNSSYNGFCHTVKYERKHINQQHIYSQITNVFQLCDLKSFSRWLWIPLLYYYEQEINYLQSRYCSRETYQEFPIYIKVVLWKFTFTSFILNLGYSFPEKKWYVVITANILTTFFVYWALYREWCITRPSEPASPSHPGSALGHITWPH